MRFVGKLLIGHLHVLYVHTFLQFHIMPFLQFQVVELRNFAFSLMNSESDNKLMRTDY